MEKIRIFELFSHEGEHMYTFKVEQSDKEEKLLLYASKSNEWTTPGKLIMSAVDTGNMIVLDKEYKDMEYDEMDHLRIILNMREYISFGKDSPYKVIEHSGEFTI